MGVVKTHHSLKQSHQALATIDFAHYQIHDEKSYTAYITAPTLGDGDSVEMYFKMPDSDIEMHTVVSFSGELGGVAEIRRSATVSLSGSVVTIFNDNHRSTNTSTMTVRSSPTLTGSGTRFAHFHVGGGKNGGQGGESGSRREFIGQQGTIYIARYTSVAGSNEADIEVNFYEED